MSEYQYYEFLAIDHPLTRKQMSEVREFSTRAEITATRFVNEYNWGNFKGKPDLMVTKYFDLMYYYANWGTHRLLLGVPADGIDLKAWKVYASSEISSSGRRPAAGGRGSGRAGSSAEDAAETLDRAIAA